MDGIRYMDFIVPGLVMMSVIQNSYGNISSSFFGAKFGRHVEELLVSPMPNWVILGGYVTGAVLRGLMVGAIVLAISMLLHQGAHAAPVHHLHHGAAGRDDLLARRLRQRGVREEVRRHRDRADLHPDARSPTWAACSIRSSCCRRGPKRPPTSIPIFYMVNAFRYGLLGISDVPMWAAYGLMLAFVVALAALGLWLLKRGVGLRS